ncbi:MAG: hypothetical protein C0404_14120 [Verrucomicrobia bacterium]|nr:hypothetical protein [Verrucomicrobiota bacterium]
MSAPPRDQWVKYKLDILALLDIHAVFKDIRDQKSSGNGCISGLCPFHDDHTRSFGLDTKTGAWECFACRVKGDVFAYLERTTSRPFKDVLLDLGDQLGLPRPVARECSTSARINYDYLDETGALLYQVVRGPGKKFWQQRLDDNGSWVKNLQNVRRVLYRLPNLIARPSEMVYIVEGEKDADRLHAAGLLATTNSGGAGKWKPSHSESLRGRDVVIIPDNDKAGREHAVLVAHELQGIAASVKIVELPNLPPKGDISDWLDAGHTIAELQALVERVAPVSPGSDGNLAGPRPVILINGRQLIEVIDDAWQAVLAKNDPPHLFTTAGRLSRLACMGGVPSIEYLEDAAAYGLLMRQATWMQQRGGQIRDAYPPKDAARDFLTNPHPDLPELEAVVSTPVFDQDWRLITRPGYHREARLWLQLNEDAATYDVPLRPSAEDLAAARALLVDDLLVDFPFAADSDRAHAVAALLLTFVRRMIDGPTPIHLIEAPIPSSGKTLLADLIAIVALGEFAGNTTMSDDENETRKKITALLSVGTPIITFDNVRDGLRSAQIAAAITALMWKDRLLGQTKIVTFPNLALWIMTANNPILSLEIARRCVRIRINPPQEQPWKRTGFKHDPIRGWAMLNRPALVRAILIIIRSWIAAGSPRGTQTLGSFESWAGIIGGMVTHLGLPGFLGDADEFFAAADLESGEWRAFVQAWHERHGTSPVGVRELIALAQEKDLVGFAYASKSETGQRMRFGRALCGLRDRKFGDLRVVVGGDRNRKINQYRLVPVAVDLFGSGEGS